MRDVEFEGRALVAAVRNAAAAHSMMWETLVPNHFEINLDAEAAEEEAFQDMAEAKRQLREHICEIYGISLRELTSLAVV